MRGYDDGHAGDGLHGIAEMKEGVAAGVAFVALHDAAPLAAAHGAGTTVGQQVDGDVACIDKERVVMGLLQNALSFFFGGKIYGLY